MATRNPVAAWRGGTRWPMILIGLLLALALAIGICEAIGWPFLVTPLQNALSKALDRKVEIGGGGGEEGKARARIGLIGSVRIRAPRFEISSPGWSDAPHMLEAQDVYLKLGYLDLWRAAHGKPINIETLEAAQLDAQLERREDGRASWQFGSGDAGPKEPADAGKPPALPTFGTLNVESGHLAYRDELLPARIDANFALRDSSSGGGGNTGAATLPASGSGSNGNNNSGSSSSGGGGGDKPVAEKEKTEIKTGAKLPEAAPAAALAPGQTGLVVQAVGSYKKLPLQIDLQTSGALSLLDEQGAKTRAQPVRIAAVVGQTEASFEGSTTDPLHLSALEGKFSVAGPSLHAVGDTLGLTLPTTPRFKTRGQLGKDGAVWKARVEQATIGSSRLEGDFSYDSGRKPPLLSGRLAGAKLVLADLGPAIGAPAKGSDEKRETKGRGHVFPDKKFDLPSLRAMDADLQIDIAEFDSGTAVLETLKPLRAHLLLADAVLTIADLEANTAKGRLLGSLQLDGRGKQADWKADLGLRNVDLAQWLQIKRAGKEPPYLSGRLDAKVDVAGSGRSTAEILGSLHGAVRAHLRDAAISHLAIEAVGIDVAQALGVLIKGDEPLRIQCNVIDLNVERGLVKPRLLVLSTPVTTLWVDGLISLKTEAMGLHVAVAPKNFSPLTLRTPIDITGQLSSPSVSIEPEKLAGKVVASGLLALLSPLAAVLPFIDPGAKEEARKIDAECAAVARRSGAVPRPASQPKNTPAPKAENSETQAEPAGR